MNISGTVNAVMYRSEEWCSFRVHGEDGKNYNCVGNAYQIERDNRRQQCESNEASRLLEHFVSTLGSICM